MTLLENGRGGEDLKSFKQFLEAVWGITWNEFDENYSGYQLQEIRDDYEYYLEHPEKYAQYFA